MAIGLVAFLYNTPRGALHPQITQVNSGIRE